MSSKHSLGQLKKWAAKFLPQFHVFPNVKEFEKRDSRNSHNSLQFSSMEMSGQLEKVFDLIDANGDGKISSLELSRVLASLSLGNKKRSSPAMKEEAKKMIRELDLNGDGFIDLQEFKDAINYNNDGISNIADKFGCKEEDDDLMDAFLMFDSDKNGFISAKELHRVLTVLGCKNCNLDECFLMIKGVDRDGNGLIDFEEFKIMMDSTSASKLMKSSSRHEL